MILSEAEVTDVLAFLDQLERRLRADINTGRQWLLETMSGHARPISPLAVDTVHDADVPEFLTMAETAEMLRLSPTTVRRMVKDGRLPSRRVGRSVRILREDVETFDLKESA